MKLFKLFILSLFHNIESLHIRNPIKSSLGGLELGVATLSTGLIMDNTLSKKSLTSLKTNDEVLYNKGMLCVYNNLIVLGPIYYYLLEHSIINDHTSNINIIETFSIVSIHSLGYYTTHRLMHRSNLFRKYHNFHHQFNETLIPSIGNAVSKDEFTFAYMTPFVIGAWIVNPNLNSFNLAIWIVSFMNLVIHTQELEDIKYNHFFVSPKTHLNHHQGKNIKGTYSAPIFNLEYIYSKINNMTSIQ